MRAPGEVQATFTAEAVIEHVATTLSPDVDSVRSKNLHNFNSLVFFFEGSAVNLLSTLYHQSGISWLYLLALKKGLKR